MSIRSIYFVLCLLILSLTSATGQNDSATDNLKSGSYANVPISQILDGLSESYGVFIYYKPNSELSRISSISFDNKSLDDVLKELLTETTLSYIDYRGYARVVAPRLVIDQSYSSDYYKALEGSLSSTGELKKKIERRKIEELRGRVR